MKIVLLLLLALSVCGLTLAGCAIAEVGLERYASEYNLKGDRLCNTDLAPVVREQAIETACPTSDSIILTEGNIQNEQTESRETQEEAL